MEVADIHCLGTLACCAHQFVWVIMGVYSFGPVVSLPPRRSSKHFKAYGTGMMSLETYLTKQQQWLRVKTLRKQSPRILPGHVQYYIVLQHVQDNKTRYAKGIHSKQGHQHRLTSSDHKLRLDICKLRRQMLLQLLALLSCLAKKHRILCGKTNSISVSCSIVYRSKKYLTAI